MEVKEKSHEITQKIRFFNRFYTRITDWLTAPMIRV